MNHLRVLTCSFIFFPFRFDPDKEIESLEKQEEEEKKKKQAKAKGMNKSAVPSNLDLKGKDAFSPTQSETQLMRIIT